MSNASKITEYVSELEQEAARLKGRLGLAETARDAAVKKMAALDAASLEAGGETFYVRRAATVAQNGEGGAIVETVGIVGPAWLTRNAIAAVIEAGSVDHIFGADEIEARLDDELSYVAVLVGGGKLLLFLADAEFLGLRAWLGRATREAVAAVRGAK